jgi:hypothetical protein
LYQDVREGLFAERELQVEVEDVAGRVRPDPFAIAVRCSRGEAVVALVIGTPIVS